jgi:hypothetical protein
LRRDSCDRWRMQKYSIWRRYWFFCGMSVPLVLRCFGLM